MNLLRLGTRGSALARAQSEWVARRLRELHPGLKVELSVIQTSGDRFSAGQIPLPSQDANVKAMFVKELEEALLQGKVDLAVHSAKDMPADLAEGLTLAAVPVREDPRDVLLAGGVPWKSLPSGSAVGTASLRRRIQLQLARPDLAFTPVRGNVDTRLRKLREGRVAALVLAAAGLKRLGALPASCEPLSEDVVVPAPGQGALGIEARRDSPEVLELLRPLEDLSTRREVDLERAFLRAVGGGCSTPLGALARAEDSGISLTVFWSDPEGRGPQRLSGRAGLRPEELSSLVSGLRARLG